MDKVYQKIFCVGIGSFIETACRVLFSLSMIFILSCNSPQEPQPVEVKTDLFGSLWNDRTADGKLFARILLQCGLESCPEKWIIYARNINGFPSIGSIKSGDTLKSDSVITECDMWGGNCHALANLQLFVHAIDDSALAGTYTCISDTGVRSGGFRLAICHSNPHSSIIGQDTFKIGDCWTYCEADTQINSVMIPPTVYDIYIGIHTIRIIDTISLSEGHSFICSTSDSGMIYNIITTKVGRLDSIKDSSETTAVALDTLSKIPFGKTYLMGFPGYDRIACVQARYVMYKNDTLILESKGASIGSQYTYLQKIGYLKSTFSNFTMESRWYYHLNLLSFNATPIDTIEIQTIENNL